MDGNKILLLKYISQLENGYRHTRFEFFSFHPIVIGAYPQTPEKGGYNLKQIFN